MIACGAPPAPGLLAQDVTLEVTLNGEEYTTDGVSFRFYRSPVLVGASPSRGSASVSHVLTLTRSSSSESGEWNPLGEATQQRCQFKSVTRPEGVRQVPFSQEVNATIADTTELLCVTPTVNFVAPVHVSVTLNGQQYTATGPTFTYEDNWHSPPQSGEPPSRRHGMAAAVVDKAVYIFGGEDGSLDASEGFAGDMWKLHLDLMSNFYPSKFALDLAWQKLSLSTGGTPPSPRAHHSLTAWSSMLLLFGGASSIRGEMHNSTYEFSIAHGVWRQLSVSGDAVAPRSAHSAVICSLDEDCSTADGRSRLFVFGGWGMGSCGGSQPCLKHRNDLLALDLVSMRWEEVPVNREQPLPPARKGHTATVINGTLMLVFGGSAWVPDPEADNSYGYTTRHVNDLWAIDLGGSDGFTWKPVHTIGDAPTPREGHTATLIGGRYLVLHGGYSGYPAGYRNDTYVLDTASKPMLWTRPTLTGAVPRSRHGHVAFKVDSGKVMSFGGMSRRGYEHDLHILEVGLGNEMRYPDLVGAAIGGGD